MLHVGKIQHVGKIDRIRKGTLHRCHFEDKTLHSVGDKINLVGKEI